VAFTQTQIDAIDAALAAGVTSVSHNGKTVTYRNAAEMLALRDRMVRELAGNRQTTVHLARFRRDR